MLSPYDKRTETTRELIHNNNSYIVNEIYQHSSGFLYYINQRGYFHIIKIAKEKVCDTILYCINDYILTVDNTIKFHHTIKHFNSMVEAVNYMSELTENE